MQTEDYSVTGLAQLNVKGHLDSGERIVAASVPAASADLAKAISGCSYVQFAATDSGKLLLVRYDAKGLLTVTHLNAAIHTPTRR